MKSYHLYNLTIILSAAMLFAACASTDEPVASQCEMRFEISGVSRSSVTSAGNIINESFAIFADRIHSASAGDPSVLPACIYNNTPVQYINSVWTVASPQFWFDKHEHSFVAIHPASVLTADSRFSYVANQLSFSYTLPTRHSAATDILSATHRRSYTDNRVYDEKGKPTGEGAALPVSLKFSHIMSRINFLVTNNGAAEVIKVTNVELDGIDRTGRVVVAPAPLVAASTSTDDYTLSWTNFTDPGTLSADIAVEVPDDPRNSTPLFPDSDALFLVPQPDNYEVMATFTATLIYKNGTTSDLVVRAAAPIGGWLPGKVYTYSLTLNADSRSIPLTVTVSDWINAEAIGDITVPRK